METREIKLLWGYLPNVDYPHAAARSQGLTQRLTIMLAARPRYNIDCYYDAELALRLVRAVSETLEHDSLVLQLSIDGRPESFHSLEEIRRHYLAQPPCARDPISRGRLLLGDKPVCLISVSDCTGATATEAYAGHYCIMFYVADYDRERITAACRAVCRELGAVISEEIEGGPTPKVSFWTRLYDFIDSNVEDDDSV